MAVAAVGTVPDIRGRRRGVVRGIRRRRLVGAAERGEAEEQETRMAIPGAVTRAPCVDGEYTAR